MTGEALLPDTLAIIEQLEALSGYPVSCVADPAIGTLATISAATPDRPIHLIRYRPGVLSRDVTVHDLRQAKPVGRGPKKKK